MKIICNDKEQIEKRKKKKENGGGGINPQHDPQNLQIFRHYFVKPWNTNKISYTVKNLLEGKHFAGFLSDVKYQLFKTGNILY
jgi:hypothetical protein